MGSDAGFVALDFDKYVCEYQYAFYLCRNYGMGDEESHAAAEEYMARQVHGPRWIKIRRRILLEEKPPIRK